MKKLLKTCLLIIVLCVAAITCGKELKIITDSISKKVEEKNDFDETETIVDDVEVNGIILQMESAYNEEMKQAQKFIKSKLYAEFIERRKTLDVNGEWLNDLPWPYKIYSSKNLIYIQLSIEGGAGNSYASIMLSTDGGQTYKIKNEQYANGCFMEIIKGSDIFVITEGVGVWRNPMPRISYDYGETWINIDYNINNIMKLPEYNDISVVGVLCDIDYERGVLTFKCTTESDFFSIESVGDCLYEMKSSIYEPEKIIDESFINDINNDADEYVESGYLYKNSNSEYLNRNDLIKRYNTALKFCDVDDVCDGIQIAINEIYARKGYDFRGNRKVYKYFEDKKWYKPKAGKVIKEEQLNQYEKANIDLLKGIKDYLIMKD